jgi:hypothetical protein
VYHHSSRFADRDCDQLMRRSLMDKYCSFSAPTDAHGVDVEPVFVESHHVDRAIAQTADQYGVDLIVMSSRPRSWAARIVHASISEKAIRQSRTSVLVLKSSDQTVGLWQALRERLWERDDIQFS